VWLIGRAESRRIFGFACKTMAISHRENAIAPKAVQTLSSRPRRACRVQVLLTRPSRSGSFFDRVIGFAESHRIFGFACKTMAISHRENAIAPKSVQTLILTSEARVQSSSPVTRTKKGTRPSRSGSFFDRVIGFAESHRIFARKCHSAESRSNANPHLRGARAEFKSCYPYQKEQNTNWYSALFRIGKKLRRIAPHFRFCLQNDGDQPSRKCHSAESRSNSNPHVRGACAEFKSCYPYQKRNPTLAVGFLF